LLANSLNPTSFSSSWARPLKRSSTLLERQKSKEAAVLALQRDPDILKRGQMRKHRRNLERAHQPRRATSAGAIAVMSCPL
jgi:hypothetical protein